MCSKMAASLLASKDTFSCPICLDLLNDPVAIPCGHSYCLDCIKGYWDQNDQMGVYSCPQCRQTFTPRPVLNKNTMLAELAEGLRKMRLQSAPPDDSNARPGDVDCDVCTGTKHKAVKSCLVCLMSFCTTHLQPHYESPAYRKHKLVDTSVNLQEKICPQHDKLLEIYCRSDQKFICYLCVMDEHRGHDTVTTAAERSEKQKQLLETQRKFQQRIQQREKELQDLCRSVQSLRRSAQTAVEDSEKVFTKLMLSIERKRAEVKEQIRAQEEAELRLAEDLQKKLEQEIAILRRRDTELEQLSHTDDHIHFLQSFQSLSYPDVDLSRSAINTRISTEQLQKAVSEVKKQVEKLNRLQLVKLSGGSDSLEKCDASGNRIQPGAEFKLPINHQLVPSPEPKTREDFLKYSCRLTFDANTAHNQLLLSERNRKVTFTYEPLFYPVHPERFDTVHQVLCRESLSERCYWEVERPIPKQSIFAAFIRNWSIAVCYKDISRKGDGTECIFGCNDQSWSLRSCRSSYSFHYNNEVTQLGAIPSCSRIGVYVDHSAGILSFYRASNTMTLLHTVHTTFTNPLYAGAGIYGNNNYVKICDLN